MVRRIVIVVCALALAVGAGVVVSIAGLGGGFDMSNGSGDCGGAAAAKPVVAPTAGTPTDAQIAKTLIIGFDTTTPPEVVSDAVSTFQPAGIFIKDDSHDAVSKGYDKAFFTALSSLSSGRLIIASDEEGGKVHNFSYSTAFPSAHDMGGLTNEQVAGVTSGIGKELADLGVNTVLAPVVDLDSGQSSDVDIIGGYERSFSADPATVTERVDAAATGFEQAGITVTFKHFPGLEGATGASGNNTDKARADSLDIGQLKSGALTPYSKLLSTHPHAMVMLSNENVTGLDPDHPASVSSAVVSLLRTDYKFAGTITTDDLNVPSVTSQQGSLSQAVADALNAGVTAPLFSGVGQTKSDVHNSIQSIINAVKANVPAGTIDAAVQHLSGSDIQDTVVPTTQGAPLAAQAPQAATKPVIALDPGHGIDIPDYLDVSGLEDREMNNQPEGDEVLDVAGRVRDALESSGYTVVILRSDSGEAVDKRTRVTMAVNKGAALAVSIHTSPGPLNDVWPQRVGSYREYGDTKLVFTNTAVAALSQKYANAIAAAREASEGHPISQDDDLSMETSIFGDQREDVPSKGNISLVQLWGESVPWVYSEIGQNDGKAITEDLKAKYAAGLINGIKAAIPVTATANAAPAPAVKPVSAAAASCCKSGTNTPAATTQPVSMGDGSNPMKAMAYLTTAGNFKDYQAASIIGNFQQESYVGLLPASQQDKSTDKLPKNGVGFGIAQWTFTSRQKYLVNLARKEGFQDDATDLKLQLDYVMQELHGVRINDSLQEEPGGDYAGVLAPMMATGDIVSAATVWFSMYEQPGDDSLPTRITFARKVLADWKAQGGGTGGSVAPVVVQASLNTPKTAAASNAGCSGSATNAAATVANINCDSTAVQGSLATVRRNVVCVAQAELATWDAGGLAPSNGYFKYNGGIEENWCSDFASWVYNQAGYGFGSGQNWRLAAVTEVWQLGSNGGNFSYQPAGSYTPVPGDLVIHKGTGAVLSNPATWTASHINIVVAVDGNTMTLIGGNQGHGPFPGGSTVTKYTDSGFSGTDDITGYVVPVLSA